MKTNPLLYPDAPKPDKAPSEHMEQSWLFEWLGKTRPDVLAYAVPNAGLRQGMQGLYFKAEGLKKGVPDICVAEPRGPWHGLYIEMKTEIGKTSNEQKDWLVSLLERGYMTAVCRGAVAAGEHISWYLDEAWHCHEEVMNHAFPALPLFFSRHEFAGRIIKENALKLLAMGFMVSVFETIEFRSPPSPHRDMYLVKPLGGPSEILGTLCPLTVAGRVIA
jgi:hypothetical protein